MDNQTAREQFVVDTFKRLHPEYTARIHAEGSGPVVVVVSTPAGATASYPVNVIGDRYALLPQADADAATLDALKQDGLYLAPPVADSASASHTHGKMNPEPVLTKAK